MSIYFIANLYEENEILLRHKNVSLLTLLGIEKAKFYSSSGASVEPCEPRIASAFRAPMDHRDVSPAVSNEAERVNNSAFNHHKISHHCERCIAIGV